MNYIYTWHADRQYSWQDCGVRVIGSQPTCDSRGSSDRAIQRGSHTEGAQSITRNCKPLTFTLTDSQSGQKKRRHSSNLVRDRGCRTNFSLSQSRLKIKLSTRSKLGWSGPLAGVLNRHSLSTKLSRVYVFPSKPCPRHRGVRAVVPHGSAFLKSDLRSQREFLKAYAWLQRPACLPALLHRRRRSIHDPSPLQIALPCVRSRK